MRYGIPEVLAVLWVIMVAALVIFQFQNTSAQSRPIPEPEPVYSSHIVITLEGDTVPCMMVEHYGAIALDCDWR